MAGARTLADDDVRRMRVAAQLLHRPRRRSAADLVRYLTGVQAQLLPAARLALRARTEGLTAERVDRARLRDRSIVVTWAMRGTLHLVPAEDYGWLVSLTMAPQLTNAHRRIRQEGVRDDHRPRALRMIERMLHSEGPLTRREIAERLRRKGIRSEGQATTHLLFMASAKGVICRGPDRGREPCFVLVRDWLGPQRPMDVEAALAELATRYLRAHGPAEPTDLAYWAGIRLGDARLGWQGGSWGVRSRNSATQRQRAICTQLPPCSVAAALTWNEPAIVGSCCQRSTDSSSRID